MQKILQRKLKTMQYSCLGMRRGRHVLRGIWGEEFYGANGGRTKSMGNVKWSEWRRARTGRVENVGGSLWRGWRILD